MGIQSLVGSEFRGVCPWGLLIGSFSGVLQWGLLVGSAIAGPLFYIKNGRDDISSGLPYYDVLALYILMKEVIWILSQNY